MSPEVGAALLGGLFTLLVALLALLQALTARRDLRATTLASQAAASELERLKAQLSVDSSKSAARLAYESQARQRLYTEIEPLFFELSEALEVSLDEIQQLWEPDHRRRLELTTEARERLSQGGWIGSTSYDIAFATYALLSPLAYIRLIQRGITSVDLGLDRRAHMRWVLLRGAYEACVRDNELAGCDPPLEYTPRVDDWRIARQTTPARYWWQGLTRGRLDNAIEVILVEDGPRPRLSTFGEFERRFKTAAVSVPSDDDHKALGAFANPLFDFDPETRPVFCRVIAVQSVLYSAILSLGETGAAIPTGADLAARLEFKASTFALAVDEGDVLRGVVDQFLGRHVRPKLLAMD